MSKRVPGYPELRGQLDLIGQKLSFLIFFLFYELPQEHLRLYVQRRGAVVIDLYFHLLKMNFKGKTR